MSALNEVIYMSENSKVECKLEGHIYGLVADELFYDIAFQNGAVKEVGGRNGWQNEELLAVLINRMKFLNGKFACRENSIVITKLEEALMWLEKRTADRKNRNVEGLNKV